VYNMKILFLTHRVAYPPNKGDKLRAFNIIKHLSGQHSIHLACVTENRDELKYANELTAYCKSVNIVYMGVIWRKIKSLFCLLSGRPLTLPYFYSYRLHKKIKESINTEKYGLIYIYSSSMAQYVLDINGIPKIMDFIDVDSEKWRQYSQYTGFPLNIVYKLESRRLRKYEEKIANLVDHCIVVSQEERALFKSFLRSTADEKISVVSNGVDFQYFKPASLSYEKGRLIFTGAMDYFANVDAILYFYKEIFPLIKKQVPLVKLYIVGSNPAGEIKKLAADKDVIVTGFVKDIRPYLEKSAVCVVPLRIGRGIRNKILEAMSMGVPVVAMSEAVFGIEAKDNEELFVEDNPGDFVERTIALLKDQDLRLRLSQNGRKFIENNYNWGSNLAKLDTIIERLVNG